MTLTLTAYDVPLRLDDTGVVRVGASRVTLDTVIGAYQRGHSPETIASQFPAVSLADVYGVVAYYLKHQAEIDDYLAAQREESEALRRELEDRSNPVGLREALRARLNKKQSTGDAES